MMHEACDHSAEAALIAAAWCLILLDGWEEV